MNSNFNQRFNQGFGNLQSFDNHQQQLSSQSFNQERNQNFDQDYFDCGGGPSYLNNNRKSNQQSSFTLNSPGSPPNTFDSTFCQPASSSGQLDFGRTSSASMGENMFNQSSSSFSPLTPTNSPFQMADNFDQQSNYGSEDQQEYVQNYGARDSEVYREKRDRNNEAVRRARQKFQKKNQEVIKRLEVLREENKRLLHKKEIIQKVHDEFKDLTDSINFCRN